MWCKTAVFFDYYLATLHPLLILILCVVLYTRKLPPKMTPPSPMPTLLDGLTAPRRQTASHPCPP